MTLIATCHCGATRIELPHAPETAKECNCSYCGRVGAVWAYFSPDEVKLEIAHDGTYSASGGMNQHHFCQVCGSNTHGDSPDWASAYNADGTSKTGDTGFIPSQRIFSVNMRMVDGFDLDGLRIEKMNGRDNW